MFTRLLLNKRAEERLLSCKRSLGHFQHCFAKWCSQAACIIFPRCFPYISEGLSLKISMHLETCITADSPQNKLKVEMQSVYSSAQRSTSPGHQCAPQGA